MMGALLGVVLTGVSSSFWSWQGEKIKGKGREAKEAVIRFRDRVGARVGSAWESFVARVLFWCDTLRIFKQNNL